jgi:hypothetical protein
MVGATGEASSSAAGALLLLLLLLLPQANTTPATSAAAARRRKTFFIRCSFSCDAVAAGARHRERPPQKISSSRKNHGWPA